MLYRTLDPWRQINDIQREMNRLFDVRTGRKRHEYPAVNIWTDTDKAMVTAELPGYDKKDIDISLTGDLLRIHGSRKAPECKEDECFHRQERSHGVFDREIKLPFTIDQTSVEATLENGILSVSLSRAEEDKPKKIEIRSK
jgi:HSP20 family protein